NAVFMTTPYNLVIPVLGVNANLIYIESKISDIDPQSIFFPITIAVYTLEMIFLLAVAFLLIPAILTFQKKAKLHENLKRISICYCSHVALYLILRSIIFVYQIRLFPLMEDFSYDFAFVFAHFSRVYHVYSLYSIMLALVVERCAATVLVSDYEVNLPLFYKFFENLLGSKMSHGNEIVSISANDGKTGNIHGHVIMVSQLLVSTVLLTIIWLRNIALRQRLKMIIAPSNQLTAEYTIAKKYQVHENLRSFKFIRNLVGACIPLGAISLAIAYYNLEKPQATQSFMRSFVDLFTTGGQLLSLTVGIFSLPEWRGELARLTRIVLRRRGAKSATKAPNASVSVTQPNEGELYFSQLRSSWDEPTMTHRHLLILLLALVATVTGAAPRRTTIETVVETVTRRVVHYLLPQCRCDGEVDECKKEAMNKVSTCFEKCDGHLKSFRKQTKLDVAECFSKNVKNAVEADECLFNGMNDFCNDANERKFIMPSNFSEAVGFDLQMAPSADAVPDVPMFKRALAQFNVFQDFFGCTKKCVHSEMTSCFARRRCAVQLPPRDKLKPIFEKCNSHTPEMSLSLYNTCTCLAYRKGVSSLYGICPIISNPLFIEN
ncbi:hypothetical protein PFISCL1PPCAC_15984, partial [Pristionchus fissidentatus]